ncbi:MAG: thioredoxin domain-containing protein [Candidatus Andersenbacteria bacterium]
MPLSADAKFGIGVVAVTVLIIIGGAFYANRNNTVGPDGTTRPINDPARLVRPDSPATGAENPQVTFVEFGDFECPSCAAFHPVLSQLKEQYKEQPVRFIYRQFPIRSAHPQAQLAAEASLAAHAQGKFWEYHDLLFSNQRALARENLERYAEQLELNMDEFRKALDDGTYKDAIEQDLEDGRIVGVPGTPSLFINDSEYLGERSVSAISTHIDSLLAPN